ITTAIPTATSTRVKAYSHSPQPCFANRPIKRHRAAIAANSPPPPIAAFQGDLSTHASYRSPRTTPRSPPRAAPATAPTAAPESPSPPWPKPAPLRQPPTSMYITRRRVAKGGGGAGASGGWGVGSGSDSVGLMLYLAAK